MSWLKSNGGPVIIYENNYTVRTCSTDGRNSKFTQKFGRNTKDRYCDFVSASTL
jgi:hypothetical protein